MQLTINVNTGLVDRYAFAGVEYVAPGAFAPTLYQDSPDPWYMAKNNFSQRIGAFTPVNHKCVHRYTDGVQISVPAVRIVEDGEVRMLVEAEFIWGKSKLV